MLLKGWFGYKGEKYLGKSPGYACCPLKLKNKLSFLENCRQNLAMEMAERCFMESKSLQK